LLLLQLLYTRSDLASLDIGDVHQHFAAYYVAAHAIARLSRAKRQPAISITTGSFEPSFDEEEDDGVDAVDANEVRRGCGHGAPVRACVPRQTAPGLLLCHRDGKMLRAETTAQEDSATYGDPSSPRRSEPL
jgi:hypothetical protein